MRPQATKLVDMPGPADLLVQWPPSANNAEMFSSLRNQFLIAMPSLAGSGFSNTVTYLCEHNEQGALGIVINQPLGLCMRDLFQHLEINVEGLAAEKPVLAGGPVQTDRGFVLHDYQEDVEWASSLQVSQDVWLTTSRDIIEAIAAGTGPKRCLVALGYAGWAPGQLDSEISANAWLTSDADTEIIFNTPFADRAQAAAAKLGFDLNLIVAEFGNA